MNTMRAVSRAPASGPAAQMLQKAGPANALPGPAARKAGPGGGAEAGPGGAAAAVPGGRAGGLTAAQEAELASITGAITGVEVSGGAAGLVPVVVVVR